MGLPPSGDGRSCFKKSSMPTIAIVDGVKIQMFYNDHTPPHFHATIAGEEVLVSIRSLEVIRGSLPSENRPSTTSIISSARGSSRSWLIRPSLSGSGSVNAGAASNGRANSISARTRYGSRPTRQTPRSQRRVPSIRAHRTRRSDSVSNEGRESAGYPAVATGG